MTHARTRMHAQWKDEERHGCPRTTNTVGGTELKLINRLRSTKLSHSKQNSRAVDGCSTNRATICLLFRFVGFLAGFGY
uniref:Uncharacterized protein n=1 Tax=Panagrellus redivivus TaxID=6233 RepID=A0A7E4VQ58_PANRE